MCCGMVLMSVLCKAAKHAEPSKPPPNFKVTITVGSVAAAHRHAMQCFGIPEGCLNVLWLAGTAARNADTVRAPDG